MKHADYFIATFLLLFLITMSILCKQKKHQLDLNGIYSCENWLLLILIEILMINSELKVKCLWIIENMCIDVTEYILSAVSGFYFTVARSYNVALRIIVFAIHKSRPRFSFSSPDVSRRNVFMCVIFLFSSNVDYAVLQLSRGWWHFGCL